MKCSISDARVCVIGFGKYLEEQGVEKESYPEFGCLQYYPEVSCQIHVLSKSRIRFLVVGVRHIVLKKLRKNRGAD